MSWIIEGSINNNEYSKNGNYQVMKLVLRISLFCLIIVGILVSLFGRSYFYKHPSVDEIVKELNQNKGTSECAQGFDTLAYLRKLNLREEVNELENTVGEKLDTFILQNMAFACFCPSWLKVNSLKGGNYYKYGYYLKPASENLTLPDCFRAGTIITFVGKVSHRESVDEYEQGNELTYYYYKIHRPYFIWGERCFDEYVVNAFDEIDSIYLPRQIVVE
ncbi:hypothetical protein [Aureispira sp. CCB-E]|uniref:hypothetical protein n=1 Tax=Aureispira sp. CCB-E TaxID=3051121 RepID=UPI0028697151|nr:hypothetical protein [Aureispira sp. CCB-E]WMX16612.1 hypothetical protein QP953_09560 [Aureispira sp. CCB-E]